MKKTLLLTGWTGAAALATASPASAGTCPDFSGSGSHAADCNFVITINPNSSVTTSVGPAATPYDGTEDQLVGVVNNGPVPLTSLALTGSNIFGFDGDGIQGFGGTAPGSGLPGGYILTGYEGPDNYFTVTDSDHGLIHFIGALANGGTGLGTGATTYFSLENTASASGLKVGSGVPEPATWAMMILGFGAAGVAFRRRKSRQLAIA